MLAFLILVASIFYARADSRNVVSLGANLDKDQRQQMLYLFGVREGDAEIIETSNKEEREYLQGLVSQDKIGSRAISSAYVEILDEGEGIQVETHNNSIANLMEKISKLDLDVDKLTDQLENISGHLDNIRETIEENRGLIQQVIAAIQRFFKWLADLLRG